MHVSLLLCILSISGCGGDEPKTLNSREIEAFLSEDASAKLGVDISVDCPNHIVAKKGARFECNATTPDSEPVPLLAVQENTKGDVTWKMNARATRVIEQNIERGVQKQKQLHVTVNCPDLIELRKGESFECTALHQNGKRTVVRVVQADDRGSVNWSA